MIMNIAVVLSGQDPERGQRQRNNLPDYFLWIKEINSVPFLCARLKTRYNLVQSLQYSKLSKVNFVLKFRFPVSDSIMMKGREENIRKTVWL